MVYYKKCSTPEELHAACVRGGKMSGGKIKHATELDRQIARLITNINSMMRRLEKLKAQKAEQEGHTK